MMLFEMKKFLFRKEILFVVSISLVTMMVMTFRDKGVSLCVLQMSWKKTAEYSNMSLDTAINHLNQELNSLPPSEVSPDSSLYQESLMLRQMIVCASEYQKQNQMLINFLNHTNSEIQNTKNSFEKRDLSKALSMYNHKRDYLLVNKSSMEFAMLNIADTYYFDLLFILLNCTILCALFTVEYETKMHQITFCSKKGTHALFIHKLSSGLLCIGVYSFIYTAIEYLTVFIKYGLSFRLFFASVQCSELYLNCPYQLNFGQLFLINVFTRLLTGASILSIVCIASLLFKKNIIVFCSTLVLSSISPLLSILSNHNLNIMLIIKRIGWMHLFVLKDYFTEYDTVNVCGYPVDRFLLTWLANISLSVVFFVISYGLYTNILFRKQVK